MGGKHVTKPHRTPTGAWHMKWDRPRSKVCQTCYGLSERLTEPCPKCGLEPADEVRQERDVLSSNFESEVSGW